MRPINEVLGPNPVDPRGMDNNSPYNPFADRTVEGGVDFSDDWMCQNNDPQEPAPAPAPAPYLPPGRPLMCVEANPGYDAALAKAKSWSMDKGDPTDLVQWFAEDESGLGQYRWDQFKNQFGASFKLLPDGYKSYPVLDPGVLDDSHESYKSLSRYDIDHIYAPILSKDLHIFGPEVQLAYTPETGTTKFGDGFVLLLSRPKVAVKLNGDDDVVKERILTNFRVLGDRGVFGNNSPNILARSHKSIATVDFIEILETSDVDTLWFMWYGMKMRDTGSTVYAALNRAIKDAYAGLDKIAQAELGHSTSRAERQTVVDVAMDLGSVESIVAIGSVDARDSRNNIAHGSTAPMQIFQTCTGLTGEKMGSAKISTRNNFPGEEGDPLESHIKKAIMYAVLTRYIKGASNAAFSIPKRLDGARLLWCTVARVIDHVSCPETWDCIDGVRTEVRVVGVETPDDAMKLVKGHLDPLHPGTILERVGRTDGDGRAPVHAVPKLDWLRNVLKLLL